MRDWAALSVVLAGLGYYPDRDHCWSRFAAIPSKTAKEQVAAVARRLELARMPLSLADCGAWSSADKDKVEQASSHLAAAADGIIGELAAVGGRRGQVSPGHRLCQELGTIGLEFVLDRQHRTGPNPFLIL